MRTDARELLAVGIFGGQSQIGNRIEELLKRRGYFSIGISNSRVTATGATLFALMLASSAAPRWIAFGQPSTVPSFEVATVKLSGPNDPYRFRLSPAGIYTATNVSLRVLIGNAYEVPEMRVVAGPSWVDSAKFNIEAKNGSPLPPWPESNHELSLRLRTLLRERFKIEVHVEPRETPVYNLVIANSGSRLKPAPPGESGGFEVFDGRLHSIAVPLEYLAGSLASVLGRPVFDKTNISGKFDYTLTFTPTSAEAVGNTAPSIFTAIQEQLGLKLESAKAKVDFVVIDHAEKPDAN